MKKIVRFLSYTLLAIFILVNVVTAVHAYKFTHFYNADEVVGEVPQKKPGWEKIKQVFFGINAVKRANDPPPDTGMQTIYLATREGIKIEGWYLSAAGEAKGTVLLFHGHGGNKSGVVHEAESFRKMGYHTLLTDFRAHGGSSGNTCTIGYDEGEEVKLAVDFARKKGEKNIVLWGISMGAAAITRAMNEYHLTPAKIILEMPFASIREAAGSRIRLMGIPAEPLATLVRFWGGAEQGFWAFNMKPSEYAKDITVPTLLQWGEKDPRVSKSETDRIYQHLAGKKKLVVYRQSGHQSLCKNEPEKWQQEVQAFLNR